MKIALVSPYDLSVSGGVNSHVIPLAERFRRRGHDVRVVGPASDQLADGLEEDTIVIGRPFPVPTSGSVARIALQPLLQRQVTEVLEREQFDVVHVHEPLMPVLPIAFLRRSTAINVGTFHAAKEGGNRMYSYTRPLLKRWFRKLDGKIAVSPAAERLVFRYFPGYFNIIPNGIDIDRFTDAAPFPQYRDGKPTILFVGRMEKRKGLKYLLRAFPIIKEGVPDARLIVAGEGRLREGYERWVTNSGVPDVVFVGWVSDEDLPRYYASTDVYCAPATGNESMGYVLLEAMASRKPVVASNIEGYATVITDGVEGHLVEPKNARALAGALVELLRDTGDRESMTMRARLRAEEYGWDRVAQRVLSYYERLAFERHLTLPARDRA